MALVSRCTHVSAVNQLSRKDLESKIKQNQCVDCSAARKTLWLCLADGCHKLLCGTKARDHSSSHAVNQRHPLQLNLKTFGIWCNDCNVVVIANNNIPGWKVGETVLAKFVQRKELAKKTKVTNLEKAADSAGKNRGENDGSQNQAKVHQHHDHKEEESQTHPSINPGTMGRAYVDHEKPSMQVDEVDEDQEPSVNKHPGGLIGLQNLGNTCYMNSALQSLSNCYPFTHYFLHFPAHPSPMNPNPPTNVSHQFRQLLKTLWAPNQNANSFRPNNLLHSIRLALPSFRSFHQQDSQEFLRCFLDQIHQELREPVYDWDPRAYNEKNDGNSSSEGDSNGTRGNSTMDNVSMNTRSSALRRGTSGRRSSPMPATNDSNNNDNRPRTTSDSGWNSDQEDENDEGDGLLSAGGSNSNRSRVLSENVTTTTTSSSTSSGPGSPRSNLKKRTKKSPSAGGGGGGGPSAEPIPKKRNLRYRSIVTDVFNGRLLSRVQCLTCDHVSETKETFQDLSLPIPSTDQLERIRGGGPNLKSSGSMSSSDSGIFGSGGSLESSSVHSSSHSLAHQNQLGWLSWVWNGMKGAFGWSWSFVSWPEMSLTDCLSAFFTPDDLRGDDMYSCGKCKKLRNGVKTCRLISLPEILCVHLKRFRHEVMYSSKIGTKVTFPLDGLDLKPWTDKTCKSNVSTYELVAIINHQGNAEGGHYIAFCRNHVTDQWYEYDDSYVTEVGIGRVLSTEAYVLFYQKTGGDTVEVQMKARTMLNRLNAQGNKSSSLLVKYHISREWIERFNSFIEPGPISNTDFLCHHGGIAPSKARIMGDLQCEIHSELWKYLEKNFGGGPICNTLVHCLTCQQEELRLRNKIIREADEFKRLERLMKNPDRPFSASSYRLIAEKWLDEWDHFIAGNCPEPPGEIDNRSLLKKSETGRWYLRLNSKYMKLSLEMWDFFHGIYGGGPVVLYTSDPQPTEAELNEMKAEEERLKREAVHRMMLLELEQQKQQQQQQQEKLRVTEDDDDEEDEEEQPQKLNDEDDDMDVCDVVEEDVGLLGNGGGQASVASSNISTDRTNEQQPQTTSSQVVPVIDVDDRQEQNMKDGEEEDVMME